MPFTLYGANVSLYVRKVRVVCAEKGLDYRLLDVDPFDPPKDWKKISPLGKIPALDHDGKIINDSRVICAYLECIQPEPRLYPKDPYEYAQALWLQEFTEGAIAPAGQAPEFLPFNPMKSAVQPTPAEVAAALRVFEETLVPLLSYVDERIGPEGYLVGNSLSIADISLASALVNARLAGLPPDPNRLPRLATFVERMHSRPSFAACIEEERRVHGKRWR